MHLIGDSYKLNVVVIDYNARLRVKAESFEDIHELYQKEMLSGPNLNFDTELESISRMRSKPIVKNKCLKEIVEAKGGHFFNILL